MDTSCAFLSVSEHESCDEKRKREIETDDQEHCLLIKLVAPSPSARADRSTATKLESSTFLPPTPHSDIINLRLFTILLILLHLFDDISFRYTLLCFPSTLPSRRTGSRHLWERGCLTILSHACWLRLQARLSRVNNNDLPARVGGHSSFVNRLLFPSTSCIGVQSLAPEGRKR